MQSSIRPAGGYHAHEIGFARGQGRLDPFHALFDPSFVGSSPLLLVIGQRQRTTAPDNPLRRRLVITGEELLTGEGRIYELADAALREPGSPGIVIHGIEEM